MILFDDARKIRNRRMPDMVVEMRFNELQKS
jgi:hypothetical protein